MAKNKSHSDGLKVKGFFRVQLTEDGKGVVGDSGWNQNQVTDLGIRQYIVDWLCSGAGKSITYMALGTGTVVGAAATALIGELTHSTSGRAAVSSSVVASGTAQFTGAFASAASFVTTTANISCIGLYNTSTTNVGTLFAGNTFASSSCAKLKLMAHSFARRLKNLFKVGGNLKNETIPNQTHLLWEGVTNGWRAPILVG